MIWNLYEWLNKFYSFYTAAIIGIISRTGISIDACHRNQTNKSKLVLKLLSLLKQVFLHKQQDRVL